MVCCTPPAPIVFFLRKKKKSALFANLVAYFVARLGFVGAVAVYQKDYNDKRYGQSSGKDKEKGT